MIIKFPGKEFRHMVLHSRMKTSYKIITIIIIVIAVYAGFRFAGYLKGG